MAFLIFVALFGVALGSFGNVVVLRGIGKSASGRSKCPKCKHTLSAMDLIPVLSFIMLGGRCRYCRKPISWQYPLVELASALLFVLAFVHVLAEGSGWGLDVLVSGLLLAIALWLLLLIAVFDGRTGLIPDELNLPLLAVGIAYTYVTGGMPWMALVVCGGFFLFQWIVSRGTWVGSGDIILAAGIGALVGTVPQALLVLLLAYIMGALVASALLVRRRKTLKSSLAFGPFLAGAGMVVALWGDRLLQVMFGA